MPRWSTGVRGVPVAITLAALATLAVPITGVEAQDANAPPPFDVVRERDGTTPDHPSNSAYGNTGVSADGRLVVFEYDGPALTATRDGNGVRDIHLWDRLDDELTLLSTTVGTNTAADGGGAQPWITPDGRSVFYQSAGDVASGANGALQLVRHDVATGTTTIVSQVDGRPCAGISSGTWAASDDATVVAFDASCPDAFDPTRTANVEGTTNFVAVGTATTHVAPTTAAGDDCGGPADEGPAQDVPTVGSGYGLVEEVSADGRYVTYRGVAVADCLERVDATWERGGGGWNAWVYDRQSSEAEPLGGIAGSTDTPGLRATSRSDVWLFARPGGSDPDDLYLREGSDERALADADPGGTALGSPGLDGRFSDNGDVLVITRTDDGQQHARHVDLLLDRQRTLVSGSTGSFAVQDLSQDGSTVLFRGDPGLFGTADVGEGPGESREFAWDELDGFTRLVGTTSSTVSDTRGRNTDAGWLSGSGSVAVWHDRHPGLVDRDDNGRHDLFATPIDPAARLAIAGIEVNQGVTNTAWRSMPDVGQLLDYATDEVPLLAGRDTVVRLYPTLTGDGAEPVPASARLLVRRRTAEGRLPDVTVTPNVSGQDVTPVRNVARDGVIPAEVFARMRFGDETAGVSWDEQTIELVLPRAILPNDVTELELIPVAADSDEALSGGARVTLRAGPRLVVDYVEAVGPYFAGVLEDGQFADAFGTPVKDASIAGFIADVQPYIQAATPFSDVVYANYRETVYTPPTGRRVVRRPVLANGEPVVRGGRVVTVSATTGPRDCQLLSPVAQAMKRSRPAGFEPGPRDWTVTALVAPYMNNGCQGIARYGDAQRSGRLITGALAAIPFGDVATHELAHTLRITHAGNSHNEGTGGGFEPWPRPHGVINPIGGDIDRQVMGVTPMAEPDGRYRLVEIDPCQQTVNVATRLDPAGCVGTTASGAGPEDQLHDLMSYGRSGRASLPEFETTQDRWPSELTWKRMVTAALDRRPDPEPGGLRRTATGDRLLVTFDVDVDGVVTLAPSERLPGAPDAGDAMPYEVVLEDAGGTSLASTDEGAVLHQPDVTTWTAELPHDGATARVVVRDRDGDELVAWEASPGVPTVSIVAPETVVPGRITVDVVAEDTDTDDQLVARVYAATAGEGWSLVSSHLDATSGPLDVELSGLPSVGGEVTLRLEVSDGLHTVRAATTSALDPVRRVAGDSRISTAVEVARTTFPDDGSVRTAVLARADNYADALSGAPLAVQEGGPMLLTSSTGLDPRVREELARLGADRVILLGGAVALRPEVEQDLRAAGFATERIAGDTRFSTAGLVADRIDATGAIVVEGQHADPNRGWPDAVSASAVAALTGQPVLLVRQGEAPEETIEALRRNRIATVTVVGGPVAVADEVLTALGAAGVTVERVAGDTRYATSAAIAAVAERQGAQGTRVWLATGANFPDALAAGPAVAYDGGVLLLTPGADLDAVPDVRAWLAAHPRLSRVTLVGGPAAITVEVEQAVRDAAG